LERLGAWIVVLTTKKFEGVRCVSLDGVDEFLSPIPMLSLVHLISLESARRVHGDFIEISHGSVVAEFIRV